MYTSKYLRKFTKKWWHKLETLENYHIPTYLIFCLLPDRKDKDYDRRDRDNDRRDRYSDRRDNRDSERRRDYTSRSSRREWDETPRFRDSPATPNIHVKGDNKRNFNV